MSEDVPITRYRWPASLVVWLMRLLAAVALGVSVMLLATTLQSTGLPGCGQGSGCDQVLNSPWSKVGPIPSAALATSLYALILMSLFSLKRRSAWWVLLLTSFLATGAAGWFVWVQASILGMWCKYCLTVHVCGSAVAVLAWVHAPLGALRVLPDDPPDSMMIPSAHAVSIIAIGLVGVSLLATVQIMFPAPTTRVTLLEGMVRFDVRQMPTIPPEAHGLQSMGVAPVVLAELFDYTCPHCKRLEGYLREARQRYRDQFTVVALPMPLDAKCNPHIEQTEPIHEHACELATLALAVWLADASQFFVMHEWLFDHQRSLTPQQARAFAVGLVGEPALTKALENPKIAAQIKINADLHHHLGGGLPKLLFNDIRIDGRPETPPELFKLLEEHTPLHP